MVCLEKRIMCRHIKLFQLHHLKQLGHLLTPEETNMQKRLWARIIFLGKLHNQNRNIQINKD